MADQQELLFVVRDRVESTIVTKLDQIANAAGKTGAAEARLATAQIKAASAAGAAAERYAASQAKVTSSTNAATASNLRLVQVEQKTAQAYLATASAQDRAAKSALSLAQARERASRSAANSNRQASGVGEAVVGSALGFNVGSAASIAAAGTTALLGAGAAVIKLTDDYNGLNNILKNVTGSVTGNGILLSKLAAIANATSIPIGAITEGFARFDRTLKPLGKTQQESLGFTETLSRMLFTYGKTGGEAASVTLQLSQAMGKGKLDGDEFRSVMENLPELGTAIAKEMGVARGELARLAPQGKITGDVIYNAMQRAKESIGELPEPIIRLDAAFTKVQNNVTLLLGSFEEGNGIVAKFAKSISNLGDNLGYLAEQENKANFLGKGLNSFDKLKAQFGLTDEQIDRTRGLREQLNLLASTWNEFDVSKGTAVSADKLLGMYEDVNAQVERLKANEVDVAKQRDAAITQRNGLRAMIATQTAAADRDIELAGMSPRERARADYRSKVDAKLKESGGSLDSLTIDQLAKIDEAADRLFDSQHKGEQGVDRAAELAKVNGQLDMQLARLSLLGGEREKQARMDAIETSLIGKKIQLTTEERDAIKFKVDALHDASELQNAVNTIFIESTAATDANSLALKANKQLLEDGKISQGEYNKNIRIAALELEKAQSPLWDRNKAIENETKLLQFNARERAIANELLAIENELTAKGLPFTRAHAEAYRAQYEQLRQLREQRAAEDAMIGSITDKQRELNLQTYTYWKLRQSLVDLGQDATTRMGIANDNGVDISGTGTDFAAQIEAREQVMVRIQELRQLEIINEQEASTAKIRIWQAEQQSKLDLASTFFSNFVGLQRSENKEVAAIGKAAAIANATITTYQAANAAYAAMAGIPVVGPALGAAAAAGAIASGIVNIQAIAAAPTGFRAGGYTGNMPANDVAGVVHGREYVIDAASTARIGRQNLDALRSGSAAVAPSGVSGGGGPTIVNNVAVFGTEEAAMAWLQGKEGEKTIVNAATKNARTIGRAIRASGG